MAFAVPFSSSPPSTPDRPHRNRRDNARETDDTNVSTTPLAPPPDTGKSFTPAGPPPSSFFGSSRLKSLGGPAADRSESAVQTRQDSKRASNRSPEAPRGFQATANSDLDDELHPAFRSTIRSDVPFDAVHGSLLVDWEAAGAESTTGPREDGNARLDAGSALVAAPDFGEDRLTEIVLEVEAIATDIAKQLGTARLTEPEGLILETEDIVSKLYPEAAEPREQDRALESALTKVPEALSQLWEDYNSGSDERGMDDGLKQWRIGPAEDETSFRKAMFVGALLLQLYHPPLRTAADAAAGRGLSATWALTLAHDAKFEAQPKVLLDWLDRNDDDFCYLGLETLRSRGRESTANNNYWNIVLYSVLRGRLADVASIFRNSDFAYAETAQDDNRSLRPYSEDQLGSIDEAVQQAAHLLESCPGTKQGDWDMSSSRWRGFRQRASTAARSLLSAAEPQSGTKGLRSSRSTGEKLPRSIYEGLLTLYTLLAGTNFDAAVIARDWLEATIFLAVWYRDEDVTAPLGLSDSMRMSWRPSGVAFSQSLESDPCGEYRRRLRNAFSFVTTDGGLPINSNDPVEVGVACAICGNVQGTLSLLQSWSLPVAAAVAEVAGAADWLPPLSHGMQGADGFDQSDLMVLSYAQPDVSASRDGILSAYAGSLFSQDRLPGQSKKDGGEIWEVGTRVLSRLDDPDLAGIEIRRLVESVDVQSNEQADKLIQLCQRTHLAQEAMRLAEKYADTQAESTSNFGAALVYYAYAHNAKKVRDVLELLVSYSLVQSAAFPPIEQLDLHLLNLLERPRATLEHISSVDAEAAALLSAQVGGYAALRRFYHLRDRRAHEGPAAELSLSQKKATVSPLLAVIASAADNVQGGLFDRQRPAVVPVEGLLVLLGEASVLLEDERRLLTLPQMLLLLRAIEDLETVHTHVFAQCDECVAAALAAGRGAKPAEPRTLLKKRVSELTASSSFSLVGSSLQESNGRSRSQSRAGSDGVRRAWDWRDSIPEGTDGRQVLATLRLKLGRAVGDAWIEGDTM